MKHLAILLFMSAVLAGCTSIPEQDEASEALAKPPAAKASTEPVISEEEFEKIPKNLRPKDLEQRDDTTVVIRAGDNKTIKEYRINGFLYGIQVIPKVGKPYYLVAADHMGNFINADKPGMLIPSWTIFEWK